MAAAQAATSRDNDMPTPPPTLCLLIPRQSFEQLSSVRNNARERRVSAVFIDQPLSRQLDLVRMALPDRHRLGVVLGPSSRGLEGELHTLASERSLILNLATVTESSAVYAALQTVIAESDLLLLLPDPVATNADTVYSLLLTSYRAQVPVAGFSEGLHNAGALVSLYSTARQQGRQGAEIASRALARENSLPAPQYPKYFTVRVNASVAHSLGLHLPAEEALSAALSGKGAGAGAKPHASDGPAIQRSEP
ncbi:MAG: ABC transporter substrate-binding protein [Rudaea sp.]